MSSGTKGSRPVDDPELRDLFPRLTRFYGLSFTELTTAPRWAIKLYAEAMPEIAAGEQLLALEASAFPHMTRADGRRVVREHLRAIRGRERLDEDPPALDPSQFGISVEEVPPPPPPESKIASDAVADHGTAS